MPDCFFLEWSVLSANESQNCIMTYFQALPRNCSTEDISSEGENNSENKQSISLKQRNIYIVYYVLRIPYMLGWHFVFSRKCVHLPSQIASFRPIPIVLCGHCQEIISVLKRVLINPWLFPGLINKPQLFHCYSSIKLMSCIWIGGGI